MVSQTLLTGIKATGQPHLGNYVGSIWPALELIQKLNGGTSYLFIADYHALTNVQTQKRLKQNVYEVTATWLACGVNPKETIIYRQSDIPEVFELYWILSCVTPKGLLNRAHSYKAYVQKNQSRKKEEDFGLNMGIFNYPLLMASDILLFQADVVPVGKDQLQHLEITRDIATKFNKNFKTQILTLPQEQLSRQQALIGLDGRKMSKSYNNDISIFSKKLRKEVMKIKTDSLPFESPKDPKTSIVFHLYQTFGTSEQIQYFQKKLEKGIGWGEAKEELYQLLENHFGQKREIYNSLILQPEKMDQILKDGAKKARLKSQKMIQEIRKIINQH